MENFRFMDKLNNEMKEIEDNFREFFNFKNLFKFILRIISYLILNNIIFYPILNLVHYLRLGYELYPIDYLVFLMFILIFLGISLLISLLNKERREVFLNNLKNTFKVSSIINYILWYSIAYSIVNLIYIILFNTSSLLIYHDTQFSLDILITYLISIMILFVLAVSLYLFLLLITKRK